MTDQIENILTTGNHSVIVAKNDTGMVQMRRTTVRQNEFNRLCEQAGLTQQEAAALVLKSDRTIDRYANGTSTPTPLVMRVLKDAARNVASGPHPVSFRFVDLFAGIGGLRIGFQAIGGHCVFTLQHRMSLAG